MCGIIETRLNKKVVSLVCVNISSRWNWESNSVESSKGCRIIVGRDPNIFNAYVISKSDQVVHLLVTATGNDKPIYVSFIYGENDVKTRINLWKNLDDHKTLA